MDISILLALGAAFSWAMGSLLSAEPARVMGANAFVRWRMGTVLVLLSGYGLLTGAFTAGLGNYLTPLLLSGFIGIFVGDGFLFACYTRLGPRRASMIFSTNAVIAAALGYFFLDERLSALALLGGATVMVGVVLAILYGKRASQKHRWEQINGKLWVGVLLGAAAALCQAVGMVLAAPALHSGVDPVAAVTARVGIALAVAIVVRLLWSSPLVVSPAPITPRLLGQLVLSGFFGMGLGMSLLMAALHSGDVGIVTVLSSTAPVILIPLLWIATGERPAVGAWVGAVLASVGTALLAIA